MSVVVLLLSLPLVADAQGPEQEASPPDRTVEAARQVTTSPDPVRLFSTPQVAVHPNDPLTAVVGVGDARNGGCGLHVTRDGGLSWANTAPTVMPDNLPFCVQRNFGPVLGLAFASNGTLYMGMSGSSVEQDHPNGPVDALVARTSDLGATHETFPVAESGDFVFETDEGKTLRGFEQHRLNSIAVDPQDPQTVYRGWRLSGGGLDAPFGTTPVRSMVAVSRDGGQTWSEPVDVLATFDDEAFGSDVPMLAVAGDGTVYGFAKERPARSPEGEARPPSRLFMFRSTDRGQNWTTSEIFEGHPFITNPAAAVDPNTGNLYVVYEARGDEQENPAEVYFLASTDGGQTWSAPVNVTDDPPAGGYNQYFPGISVAPNGRIDVAWHDFRNDPFFTPGEAGPMGTTAGERYWDVYHTFSNDGGQTWAPNVRVTDRSIDGEVGTTFNNQDIIGPMGIASTNSTAYVTWADSRAGDADFEAQDAYFSRIRFADAPLGGIGPEPQSPVLWAVIGAGLALAAGGAVLVAGLRAGRRERRSPAGEAAPVPVE